MDMSRREFAMLVSGAAAMGSRPARAIAAADDQGLSWYWTIKRIGQTNFNERDPEFGDVEAWADFWAAAKVQAVALSVSGPVAFYPTKVPFFHVSLYLKGRDLFGECLTAAKKRGIRVFGRMSPDIQYNDPELLAAHPLWFRRDQAGRLQSPAPDIAFTCQFSGQFTDQQPIQRTVHGPAAGDPTRARLALRDRRRLHERLADDAGLLLRELPQDRRSPHRRIQDRVDGQRYAAHRSLSRHPGRKEIR